MLQYGKHQFVRASFITHVWRIDTGELCFSAAREDYIVDEKFAYGFLNYLGLGGLL